VEELREIAQGNLIMMKKLQEAKPSYEKKRLEEESAKQFKLAEQMSRNATRFIKHPFFVTDNPAVTIYRKTLQQGASSKSQPKTTKT
jgi:hypothetical protein